MKLLFLFFLLMSFQWIYAGNNSTASSPRTYICVQAKIDTPKKYSENLIIAELCFISFYLFLYVAYVSIALAINGSVGIGGFTVGLISVLLAIIALIFAAIYAYRSLRKDFYNNSPYKGKGIAGLILGISLCNLLLILIGGIILFLH